MINELPYRCDKCHSDFKAIVIPSVVGAVCPNCGSEEATRVYPNDFDGKTPRKIVCQGRECDFTKTERLSSEEANGFGTHGNCPKCGCLLEVENTMGIRHDDYRNIGGPKDWTRGKSGMDIARVYMDEADPY